ncbi:hyaluronidase Tab y 2.0101-like isoform X2 [Condylostylus longicornis]|nr:hyaluronidase Tab y 2.0101-like isoform X2 [Condylostylus longicornis]
MMSSAYKIITIYFIYLISGITNNVTSFQKNFEFYWNIPSFMCHKYNINPENITKQFGIKINENDSFRGDKIAILYDPGKFPAILKYANSEQQEYFYRNKGVPQEGNLTVHLTEFENHINEFIPDKNFSGLAIIDFESWRPIYRQNFGTLKPYKELSIYLEKKLHPKWSMKKLEHEAKVRFEKAGRVFMEETILFAKRLRPYAKWGYYAFPYCFNGRDINNPESCANGVTEENDNISWLFGNSDIILPSVYLNEDIPKSSRLPLVRGRVKEATRLANKFEDAVSKPLIYVYHRYVYTDSFEFLPELETFEMFSTIKSLNADGVILWGSSNDLNSRMKCEKFIEYLKETLGPITSSLEGSFIVHHSRLTR